MGGVAHTLLVDNYDSFTYNLYHQIADVTGVVPTVIRNDHDAPLDLRQFDAIVISPGPGRPDVQRDFGICRWLIDSGLPVLGVCLGHQGIAHWAGGRVDLAPAPMHGRLSDVHHAGTELFADVPSPFRAVRYHSLVVTALPPSLRSIAWTDDDLCMALAHEQRPLFGLQFHPESICTQHGRTLLANFFRRVPAGRSRQPRRRATVAIETAAPSRLSLIVRTVTDPPDSSIVFEELFGTARHAFWLDSSAVIPGGSRFSMMGDASGPHAELLAYDARRSLVTIDRRGGRTRHDGSLFTYLARTLRDRHIAGCPGIPFNLGYVGYFGYEVADGAGADHPDASFVFADRALVFDHADRVVHLLALSDAITRADTEAWLASMAGRLESLSKTPRRSCPAPRRVPLETTPRHAPAAYLELIRRCQDQLRAGESYEICLTNMIETQARIDVLRTYLELRRRSPAPHAGLLRLDGLSILSASPERFLRVSEHGEVESKPIKGTAPRGATPDSDASLRDRLQHNEKDRAENLMIVDLVRNDLGRVCEPGTVHVPTLFAVETYATVHQLVSTVRGHLAKERSAIDAIEAAFPGGSMTGAPKKRTMEIIRDLEAGSRGIYSGAMGYLALSGAADLNIVIRTIVACGDRASIGTGGAIVALSEPEMELEETYLKARVLIETLEATALEDGTHELGPG